MCVDWVQILSDFKDLHVFISNTYNHTKNHLSDLPAHYQCPRPELLHRGKWWNWICSSSQVLLPEDGAGAAPAVPAAREGRGLRERRLWRLCTDTCCPSGCDTLPALGLALHPLRCDTSFLELLPGLYPIYCTWVLTEKWCQSTQTGLGFAETKGRSFYNITCSHVATQGSSLVLGRASLDKAVVPLGFSSLTVLHGSPLTVPVWLQCRQLQASQGILAERVKVISAQTCTLKYLPSAVTKAYRWLNSKIMHWYKCLFVCLFFAKLLVCIYLSNTRIHLLITALSQSLPMVGVGTRWFLRLLLTQATLWFYV